MSTWQNYPTQPETQPQPQSQDSFVNPQEPRYWVIIEENTVSSEERWTTNYYTNTGFELEKSRALALECAKTYKPQLPMFAQRRTVFQISPDEYLTKVDGLTADFHFRTTVAQIIEGTDK